MQLLPNFIPCVFCRNGDFASLLFLNHFEYTRDRTFARQIVWPLVSGLVNWWSCFLQRSKGANGGGLLLEDWNAAYPDEQNECQPVRNPIIGLAFVRRLASFQIMLARELGLPPPQAAIDIDRHLVRFPTNCTAAGADGRCQHNDPNASWVSYSNATVATSGKFSLYPVWPTEFVSIGSEAALRRTARRTVKAFISPADFVTQRPVLTFPAAVRAGYSATEPEGSAGYQPEVVMAGLRAWLANTDHKNGVAQDRDDGAPWRAVHRPYWRAAHSVVAPFDNSNCCERAP
eukprot:SAG11_NODE_3450_length_2441_cov_1.382579_2_plen_288_part_00